MTVPMIHLNGTSREALLDQVCAAEAAGRAFLDALANMTPNGRDYYVKGDDALRQALHEHDARVVKIKSVMTELQELAEAIALR